MKCSLLFVCLLIFISCNDNKNDPPQNNVPEALQDNSKRPGIISYSKRGREDLVDELYKEKLESAPALLAIDNLYRSLSENKLDSLEEFNNFDQKNDEYYKSADFHLKGIKDSLLKKEIEIILTSSLNLFNAKSGRLSALKDALIRAELSADDRYITMKLLITLNMIESYQNNLPSSKPIESVIGSYNELHRKMDSVISKNK